ncbi:hypothetical protein HU200_062889 [Digitaria exilis]|uniref:Uncharacterized protein n=1 Tax=Digitaria exilis TaxID=1010633 RepID=A0A835A2G2_9POAL|nr:hypothetical protein HU200_062889 [Digitaria exilis]
MTSTQQNATVAPYPLGFSTKPRRPGLPPMDGAASPQASAEEKSSGGAADLDPSRPAATAGVVVVAVSTSPFRVLGNASYLALSFELFLIEDDLNVAVLFLVNNHHLDPPRISYGYFIHVCVHLQAILSGEISLLKDLLPSIIVLSNRGPTEVSFSTNEI